MMDMHELQRYCQNDINSMYASMLDVKSIEQVNEKYRMRVLNKKYWPYHIKVEDDTGAKEKWCYENFKSSNWRNVGRYFAFKSGADATAFALKWS